jgi:hypothetical protein
LPAVIADLAQERGLHKDWGPPLDECAAIAQHWRGGSLRRLRRIVEAVLRAFRTPTMSSEPDRFAAVAVNVSTISFLGISNTRAAV